MENTRFESLKRAITSKPKQVWDSLSAQNSAEKNLREALANKRKQVGFRGMSNQENLQLDRPQLQSLTMAMSSPLKTPKAAAMRNAQSAAELNKAVDSAGRVDFSQVKSKVTPQQILGKRQAIARLIGQSNTNFVKNGQIDLKAVNQVDDLFKELIADPARNPAARNLTVGEKLQYLDQVLQSAKASVRPAAKTLSAASRVMDTSTLPKTLYRAVDSTNKGAALGNGTYLSPDRAGAKLYGSNIKSFKLDPKAKIMDLSNNAQMDNFTMQAFQNNPDLAKNLASRGADPTTVAGELFRQEALRRGFQGISAPKPFGMVIFDESILSPK